MNDVTKNIKNEFYDIHDEDNDCQNPKFVYDSYKESYIKSITKTSGYIEIAFGKCINCGKEIKIKI